MKLLSFGEVLWDVYPDRACLGGAPLNFAAHAARHGIETYMLSAVGEDALGTQALAEMRAWGINTQGVRLCPDKATGVCDVTLDAQSVPCYRLREDVAWDAITCDTLPCKADVLYFGTLALRSAHNAAELDRLLARETFEEVLVDVNIRAPFYSEETVHFAFEHATILKISEEELPIVCALLHLPQEHRRAFCRAVGERFSGVRVVIITRGENGSCAYETATQRFYEAAAVPATVVSTVGAGDSFSAAFLYGYSRGEDLAACLSYASAVAALVVSCYEAVPAYKAPIPVSP